MAAMKRVIVALAVLAGAAAGAYAQEALKTEDPSLNDVVQAGVLYTGSICGGEYYNPGYHDFYFRVTRGLKDGWVETEFSRGLAFEYQRYSFKPWPKPVRLNLRQLCSIQVAEMPK